MCPCGQHPKHVRASGQRDGYCAVCLKKSAQRKRRLRIDRRPGSLCSRCHEKPRKVNPGGSVCTYCVECDRLIKREGKRRRQQELFDRVKAGADIPTCRKEGCDRPCHVTETCVRDVCAEHWAEYMATYNDRRRPRSKAARSRRTRK